MLKALQTNSIFLSILCCLFYNALFAVSDSTINVINIDSSKIPLSPDSLDAVIHYKAQDSIIYDLPNKMVYLYGKAHIDYKTLQVDAAFVELDWNKNEIIAYATKDSLQKWIDKPVFKDGDKQFIAERMRYNFKTKKGKILQAETQEGEGYILSEAVKMNEKKELFSAGSRYTTCNNTEHPHFYFLSNKVKVIPEKVLIAGPTALYIADAPTPLVLPFGIFPVQRKRHHGILLPEFRNTDIRGFGLANGGYYLPINDYIDIALRGDIFTQGSWALRTASIYTKRYKFNGNLQLSYSKNIFGEKQDTLFGGYSKVTDFNLSWSHQQDPKNNPFSTFNANINFGSSKYFSNNQVQDPARLMNSTLSSNIIWTKRFPLKPYSLTVSANHSQNTQTRRMIIALPQTVFNIPSFYPFKRKNNIGKDKFYEKINLSYTNDFRNQFEVLDSNLFKNGLRDSLKTGIRHDIPIRANLKIFKYFSFNPFFNFSEKWNLNRDNYNYNSDSSKFIRQRQQGFYAFREYSAGADFSTRLYGTFNFKKGKIKSIRHVMNIGFNYNYRPDFKGYSRTIFSPSKQDSLLFNPYLRSLYNASKSGKVNGLGFSLNNIFEGKVRVKKDTSISEKKIKILEGLTFGGFYNFAADSFNLQLNSVALRTTLFDKLNVLCSGVFDPYALDANGRKTKYYEWDKHKRLARFESARMSLSTSLRSAQQKKQKTQEQQDIAQQLLNQNPGAYIDFSIPWDLSVNYDLSVFNRFVSGKDSLVFTQSVGFSANILLTEKWKIGVVSGYDFVNKTFTFTSIDIHRDLHCWEMRFNIVPFGTYKSYTFGINVKASVLQDLKLNKRKDWNNF